MSTRRQGCIWQGQFISYHTANVADIQGQPGDNDVCGKVSLLETTQQMWQTSRQRSLWQGHLYNRAFTKQIYGFI